jgi:dTDP-4-dehydrorhamnose 3,5-epimerase
VLYLLSSPYAPEAQRGLRWDDPTLAIPWPDPRPTLSDRDAQLPFLDDLP